MSAPIMLGVLCRWCGAQRLQRPWETGTGYLCAGCGATNWPPLLPTKSKDSFR
jgi:hypothetical protein